MDTNEGMNQLKSHFCSDFIIFGINVSHQYLSVALQWFIPFEVSDWFLMDFKKNIHPNTCNYYRYMYIID